MAGPLVASVKLTVPGEAVTVSDSPKTALKFTVGWLELNWAQEAGVTAISSAKTPKINQALCFVCISPQGVLSRVIIFSWAIRGRGALCILWLFVYLFFHFG